MFKLFLCKRIYLENNNYVDGGILVSNVTGKILKIFTNQLDLNLWINLNERCETIDFGNSILMTGLIDSHVHVNDPGRQAWEKFETATKAAAAGGFTTIIDMPLNSIPSTTSVENLNIKLQAALDQIYVDVGFWGGIVPGNAEDLLPLIECGVIGFKCFLCPSGVPEFEHVEEHDLVKALEKLKGVDTVISFHAELEQHCEGDNLIEENPGKYESYLKTKPSSMEINAIDFITKLSKKFETRFHILHLSSADPLPLIVEAKEYGNRITVETCHHYLSISAEEIPDCRTEFKCAPPIRSNENREKLWGAIMSGDIDLVTSDHSPCVPELKCLNTVENQGDFFKAWGGISSLQFGLPLFWTNGQKYGIQLDDVLKFLCKGPAKLCGLDKVKGKLDVGFDADFCVWNPEESFTVAPEIIQFQNKANPYMGQVLKGVIKSTVVRGNVVFEQNHKFADPIGKPIVKHII